MFISFKHKILFCHSHLQLLSKTLFFCSQATNLWYHVENGCWKWKKRHLLCATISTPNTIKTNKVTYIKTYTTWGQILKQEKIETLLTINCVLTTNNKPLSKTNVLQWILNTNKPWNMFKIFLTSNPKIHTSCLKLVA
jgi:hypothetical protein